MPTTRKSTTLEHCPECEESIRVGMDIEMSPDGEWIHRICYEELGYDDKDSKKTTITTPENFWNLDE